MSNRVLKKLYGDSDGLIGTAESAAATAPVAPPPVDSHLSPASDSDSLNNDSNSRPSMARKTKKLAINRFELLNNLDQNSMSDTEAKEDDDKDNDSVRNWLPPATAAATVTEKCRLEKQDSTQSTDSLKKRRKKKKKIRSQKSLEGQLDAQNGGDDEDDVDGAIQEVNKLLGNCQQLEARAAGASGESRDKQPAPKKSVICVEARHLNPENEMKRIFGSKVIQQAELSAAGAAANRRRAGRHRHSISRAWILVNPKNWQSVGKCGISMECADRGATAGDAMRFNIVHNKSYQSVQFMFMDAVESYNPDNLVAILNAHPYHIDTLIQFSDVCKMAEDNQMAAELIERALYCIEHIFHPLFNVTQANCRLDYRRPENRAFYIALFKHLSFVGQRGCNRTALEFCKLILGLDPEGDPLSVLLMIDFYALRCEQYDYLVHLYEEWEATKKLSLFPNFRYSTALALYYMSLKAPEWVDKADQWLQEALIMFPGVLLALLDKCSVEPDPQVSKCDYFRTAQYQSTQAIAQLTVLYIGRTYLLWKDKSVMSWLERNVRQVMHRVAANDPFVAVCNDRYPITTDTQTPGAAASDQGLLSVFLRSWLPDFNAEELGIGGGGGAGARNRAMGRVERQLDNDAAAGAVGGGNRRAPGDTNDLRRSVTSLLDAMRDLLSNIHMADVPNEGDVSSEDNEDDHHQHHHQQRPPNAPVQISAHTQQHVVFLPMAFRCINAYHLSDKFVRKALLNPSATQHYVRIPPLSGAGRGYPPPPSLAVKRNLRLLESTHFLPKFNDLLNEFRVYLCAKGAPPKGFEKFFEPNGSRAMAAGLPDGSYLAEFLLEKGYDVHGIIRRSSSFNTGRIQHLYDDPYTHQGGSMRLHYGDMTDSSCLVKIIHDIRPTEIYNLAAQSHVKVSFDLSEYTANVDALGTLRILDAIRTAGLEPTVRFYQASTSELYGKVQQIPQTETTPFYPRSPYGVAKLYGYWIVVNYREAYNIFAVNGILFNHESPRRGETFVTRKITRSVAKISLNEMDHFELGNLDARRDWGHARDYVEAMWLMLQQDVPQDYVISTGEAHSVREFVELAFKRIGRTIVYVWEGSGVNEVGKELESGVVRVRVNQKHFRPAEVVSPTSPTNPVHYIVNNKRVDIDSTYKNTHIF
ncbi:unnamed protein product [Oppiella nova]|uniref:GDP-mannose 4,6 dehydratase n=1 Tax=Oppiella nova TaxID=334625 RepID=A0A7R9LQ33_9ACAR|nr:unnamed protein product [Oppiella nova]CAG2165852.1 unnamed protein product [Oppiella nova]